MLSAVAQPSQGHAVRAYFGCVGTVAESFLRGRSFLPSCVGLAGRYRRVKAHVSPAAAGRHLSRSTCLGGRCATATPSHQRPGRVRTSLHI